MLFVSVLETDMTSCYFSYYLKLAISLKVVLKYMFRETTNFFFLKNFITQKSFEIKYCLEINRMLCSKLFAKNNEMG